MNRLLVFLYVFLCSMDAAAAPPKPTGFESVVIRQGLGIGVTAPSSKTALEISSTTKGVLLPRMTTTQRDAINSPPIGLIIDNTTTFFLEKFNGLSFSQFLMSNGIQTVTGKTIDGDDNTIQDLSPSSLKTASANAGKVIQYNNAGAANIVEPNFGLYNNVLPDSGFENGGTNWNYSGGAVGIATSGANYQKIGLNSGTWDSNAAAQTWTGPSFTIGAGQAGVPGLARCRVLVPSGTATHTFGIWDGTNLTNIVTLPQANQTTAQWVETTFAFGASGTTVAPRFTSVNANEPLISVDDCYVGFNFSLASSFVITEQRSTMTTNSVGVSGTVTGALGASNGSALYSYNSGTGVYTVLQTATFTISATMQVASTQVQPCINLSGSGNVSCGYANVGTAKSSATYTQVLNPGQTFYVYNAVGAGTSDYAWVAVYAWAKTNSVTTEVAPNFDTTGMMIPMTTNSCPSGTIAADGSTPLRSTYPQLNAKYQADGYPYGNGNGTTTFTLPKGEALFLRGSGSQTLGGIGYGPYNVGGYYTDQFQNHWHNTYSPTGAGGSFVWGSQAWTNNRSPTLSYTPDQGVREVTAGTGRAGSETYPAFMVVKYCIVTAGQKPVPVLVGSVSSNSSGPERIERLMFGGATSTTACTSSPCVIHSQSGNWVTQVTRSGAGNYTGTVPAGTWSATPVCTCSSGGTTEARWCTVFYGLSSPTSIDVRTYINNTTPGDGFAHVICMGPR